MATVLLTMRYGFSARNVVRTGVLDAVLKAGHRVVLVTPAAGESYFAQELRGRDVVLESFPDIRTGRRERAFVAAADALLFGHPWTTRTLTHRWLDLAARRRFGSFVGRGLAGLLRLDRSRALRRLAELFDSRSFAHPEVAAVVERHRPDLVVTCDLFGSEILFTREARRLGIPTVCLVKSWDNLTSKTRIRVNPDRIVVWSDLMREEAARYHFFPEEHIEVTGAPNFDVFARDSFRPRPRREFMRSIGADPGAKLIVYSPGVGLTASDEDNVRLLRDVVADGRLGFPVHLHVRKYPKSMQDFGPLLGPGVTQEDAGVPVESWDDRVDQPISEIYHLGELMAHADALVHVGSTIAVDAACFDTPVVAFDVHHGDPRLPRGAFARHVYDLTHNRYLVDLGGERVVRARAELEDALRTYLHRPETDREGRRRVVERIAGTFDGRAAERIARAILDAVPRPADR